MLYTMCRDRGVNIPYTTTVLYHYCTVLSLYCTRRVKEGSPSRLNGIFGIFTRLTCLRATVVQSVVLK